MTKKFHLDRKRWLPKEPLINDQATITWAKQLTAVETEKAGHCEMGKPISWPCDGLTTAFMKSSITNNDKNESEGRIITDNKRNKHFQSLQLLDYGSKPNKIHFNTVKCIRNDLNNISLFYLAQNVIVWPCPSNAIGPTNKSANSIWPNSYVIWHRISHICGLSTWRLGMSMVISSWDCIILNTWLTFRRFYFCSMSQVLVKNGQL